MKRTILTLVMVFSMFGLVACGGETQDEVSTGNKQESVVGNPINDEPTTKPAVEATAEPTPTEEPVAESTPEPTEEPSVVYEGIDMESDLPGEQWIETFVGIIDEPKAVVYSDKTGRKKIIEEEIVMINPEEDRMAIYLPDGYKRANTTMGIFWDEGVIQEHSVTFILNVEETREEGPQIAAVYAEKDSEEIAINFTLVPEE